MYYPDELIEEVRTRNDIVDVISGYVRLQKKGSSYFGLCPFHNEKSPSFSVSRQKQMYYCFGCGAGGNVFTFLMEYENFSFMEAVKFLADRAGIALPEAEYSKEAKQRADLKASILEINKIAARYYYVQLKSERGVGAHTYLTDRGLTEETITAFGLGYSKKYSDDLYKYLREKGYSEDLIRQAGLINTDERQGVYDKFWNRVMFPIMDVNYRVIVFGGRVMGDGKPKYLNSPETVVFDKTGTLTKGVFKVTQIHSVNMTEEDFILVARLLDVEVAALIAVQQVETGGRGGFFAPGKPAIIFEGHIFWNQLKKRNINPE